MEEIRRFDDAPNRPDDVRHDIRWLSAGQTFELGNFCPPRVG